MGTSTGTLTFQGQRNFGSSYCLMQSLWMPEGPTFVCHTSSVFGLLARMTHHTTMAAEFQARHPRPHPPAEGKLSLMMASMREGGSFLVQYLDLCFIHMLTAKSFMEGRGKKYLHSKAMGTHPQRWRQPHLPAPHGCKYGELISQRRIQRVIWVVEGRARCWEKTNKLPQWYVNPHIWYLLRNIDIFLSLIWEVLPWSSLWDHHTVSSMEPLWPQDWAWWYLTIRWRESHLPQTDHSSKHHFKPWDVL